jgi:hypothetical protein
VPGPPGSTAVVRHPPLRAVARAGLVAYGVVHVLVAALAVAISTCAARGRAGRGC